MKKIIRILSLVFVITMLVPTVVSVSAAATPYNLYLHNGYGCG